MYNVFLYLGFLKEDYFDFSTLPNTIIGSLIGFLGAYFIFIGNQRSIIKNHVKVRSSQHQETYRYCISMASKVPSLIDSQIESLIDVIRRTETNKFTQIAPTIVVTSHLKRLSQIQDLGKEFNSFIDSNGKKKGNNSVDEFIKFYGYIDTRFELVSLINIYIEKSKSEKKKLIEMCMSTNDLVLEKVTSIESSLEKDIQFESYYKKISEVFGAFLRIPQNPSPYDLPFYYNNLIEPLILNLVVVNKAKFPPFISDLLLTARKAGQYYRLIELFSEDEITQYKAFIEQMNSRKGEFEILLNHLKKSITKN